MFRGVPAPSQRQAGARSMPGGLSAGAPEIGILGYPANGQKGTGPMLVATTEKLAGYRTAKVLGQCFGVVVRSRGLGGNIVAGLRSIIGGEIKEYTQLLEEARRHAVDRMVTNASLMGANAIVMMRFDSSEIGQTMSEIVAYGTAVVIEAES